MCDYIKDVMESMGWTDGSFLPIANEENQNILDEITRLTKDRSEKEIIIRNADERQNCLNEHCKNAETGINQNLKLLLAQRVQATSEQHMIQVADRETSKMKQVLKSLNKEIEAMTNYEKSTEKEINRLTCSITNLTDKVNWAKLALAEWQEAISQGDETNNLIKKYCAEDETKARAIESKRRQLQNTINNRKKQLINMYDDQKTCEKNLDRIAELYRQNYDERRNLVNTWKEAVNQMNQREVDIQDAEDQLDTAEYDLNAKKDILKQNEEFLNQLIINNKEIESEISDLNEVTSEARRNLAKILDLIILKENELDIVKKQLNSLMQLLQQQRQRNQQLVNEKVDKNVQLEKNDIDFKQLEFKYANFLNNQLSAQDRLNMLEEMVNNEDKIKNQLSRESQRINSMLYRSQQQLAVLKDDEKMITTEISGTKSSIISIKHAIVGLEKQHQKTIELDYSLGLQIQIIEMRLSKLQGGGLTLTEQLKLQERITTKEAQSEAATKQLNNVRNQIEKLDSDMQKITNIYNNDTKELEKLNFKVKQSQLYVEGGDRQIKTTTQRNQGKIVELSILKMRLHEMELQISKCDDKVYSLEKHRIELEKTMKERMIDINAQLDLLKLKRRTLSDEHSILKMDLGERQIKIEASIKRYDIASELLGKNEDGTLITGTQLKIVTAQEKQLLLHEGNELNDKVLKAENEIKAMENTLCLLNYSNNSYKKTFEKLDDQNPEYIELQNSQEEYCKYLRNLKKIKNNLKIQTTEFEEAINRRELIEKELEEIIRIRTDNSETLTKVHKDILDQRVKLQRAEREINCASKAVQQRLFNSDFLIAFDKDVNLRELEEKNTNCLQLIADFIDANYEMASEFSRLLSEKGLKIPQLKCGKSNAPWRTDFSSISLTASSKGSICESVTSRSSTSSTGGVCSSVISIEFPESGEGIRVLKSKVVEKSSTSLIALEFPSRQGVKVLKYKGDQKRKKN